MFPDEKLTKEITEAQPVKKGEDLGIMLSRKQTKKIFRKMFPSAKLNADECKSKMRAES